MPRSGRSKLYLVCMLRARPAYVGGARLIAFIEDWQRCVAQHGRSVNIQEYIAWAGERQRRATFLRLKLFRATFPELGAHGLPDQLMGPLLEQLARDAELEAEAS
jgi:hypothetical protein